MNIYFAASIRGGRDDQALYLEIIQLLSYYGTVLTEHISDASLTAYGERQQTDREIHDRDLKWLEASDVVIAEVTTTSLGVGYEIGKAAGRKPVLCIYRAMEGRRLSAMISGDRDVKVAQYESLDDLKTIFERFLKH